MNYQILQSYRDGLVDKILDGHSSIFSKGHNNYLKNLSETEKRAIKLLISQIVKFENLDSDIPKIWVETAFHSATEHLDNILGQIEKDVFPLLAKTDEKGPFTVLRNTLCFCDCIARLQYGKKGSSGDLEKLFNSFGSYNYIKRRYKEYKQYLIQLYRHDLVHTIRPWSKIMFVQQNNSVTLSSVGWSVTAKLNYETQDYNADFKKLKQLLKDEKNRKNLVHLQVDTRTSKSPVINTYCFLFDLVNYIEQLKTQLKNNQGLMDQFMKNLIEIEIESSFRLLRSDILTLDLDSNKTVIYD